MKHVVCIGASKAGTTSLHDYLDAYGEVVLPAIKETHYFSSQELYDQGLDYYYSCFSDFNQDSTLVECCPQYMSSINSLDRIHETLGEDVKIVIMVRDPLERLVSHYKMKTKDFEYEDVNKVIDDLRSMITDFQLNPEMYEDVLDFNRYNNLKNGGREEANINRLSRYILSGCYSLFYNKAIELFTKDNVYIINYLDFISDENKRHNLLQFIDDKHDLNKKILMKHSNKAMHFTGIRGKIRRLIRRFKIGVLLKGVFGSSYDSFSQCVQHRFFTTKIKDDFLTKSSRAFLRDFYSNEYDFLHEKSLIHDRN